MNKFLMRSLMFVPGHNERLLKSAGKSDADVLLLDLEDSVQPVENKQIARDLIISYTSRNYFKNHKVFPRVNDRESGHLLKDVYQLTIDGIDGFMYPKAKRGEDIYFFDKLLDTIEYEKGIEKGKYKIIALIETSSAVLNVQEICLSSKRLVGIAFGCEDFVTDLGGIHDKEGQSIFTPRALIAMAGKATGITPIDTVHINVHDLDDLEFNLNIAKNLGFEGMLILHPKEIEPAHKYFSPSADEVEESNTILRLYEESKLMNKGVNVLEGKFIGPPIVASAKNVIEKSEMIKNKKKLNT